MAKVGLVGVGWWGGELVRGARVSGRLEVVACHSRDAARRSAFASERGMRAASTYDELLSDPHIEGVLIATPHSTHAELVLACLDAGKHVFVEKPLTLDLEEGRRCVEAAASAGLVLQVGHNRRRQPANRRIRGMVEQGELGTVVMAEANHSGPGGLRAAPGGWRSDRAERPLSGMTPYGVHVIDTLHSILGPIARVTAAATHLLPTSLLDDASVLAFQHASGVVGTLGTSTVVPSTNRIGVLGSGGAAWNVGDGEQLLVQGVADHAPTERPVAQLDTVADELAELAECMAGRRAPETGGLEGLRVVAVLHAALESARSGGTVEVETFV